MKKKRLDEQIKEKNIKIICEKMNKFVFFISLFFILLYIPFSFTVYSHSYHKYNFLNQDISSEIKNEDILVADKNLINYFLHKEKLNEMWNINEKKHMEDVRNIYDCLLILFFIFLIISFFYSKLSLKYINKKFLEKCLKINILITISLLFIIPFFSYFWNNIFHKIMFNNKFWIYKNGDMSYYLFPNEFFLNSLIFII
ncbi:MAG: DUF1461 domain-containing protein, partial [Nanoarchaeota archaeon]|nr:DUF1461 domain-containing protein [Nanoarchaeota archaeon]